MGPADVAAVASSVPQEYTVWISVAGALAMAVFAAWSRVFGKKSAEASGPEAPEFALVHGSFADTRPAREIGAHIAALVQAQVRCAEASEKIVVEIAGVRTWMREQADEAREAREIAEAVERRLREIQTNPGGQHGNGGQHR